MILYSSKHIYESLFEILSSAGIHELQDAIVLIKQFGSNAFCTDRGSWVNDFVDTIEANYDEILGLHIKTLGPTIVHHRLLDSYPLLNNVPDFSPINAFEIGGRYGCLFPGRVLFIGMQIVTYDSDRTADIPPSFILQLFILKPLLMAGMALFLPARTVDKSDVYNIQRKGSYYYRYDPKHIAIEASHYNIEYFKSATDQLSLSDHLECRVLNTPAICGGTLETSVSAAIDNLEQYDAYATAQIRFLRNNPNSEHLVREWLELLDQNARILRAQLEKKRQKLTTKGVECFVGGMISTAPLLIPGFPPEASAYIRSVMGGKSLYDSLQWIGQWRELQNELRFGAPWSLWKPIST